ncbi:MAG: monovalent cation/H+ antiporter complex subunit F [Actinomycetota bacterium]
MIATIALAVLFTSAAVALVRVIRGPDLADRVIALDLVLVALMTSIVVGAADTGSTAALDLLVVIAIVGFTTTVAVSRFIERTRTP